ncbi:TPA: hypothetical protein DCX16_04400 [bacterium]|nr:hypothetical protein [bacterium]
MALSCEKIANEFDYQRFINQKTTRKFLETSSKNGLNRLLKEYLNMEKTDSFISFLTTSGIKGCLGIPIQRLSLLIKERRLIPVDEIVNIEIISLKTEKSIFEYIERFFDNRNGVDNFNLSIIEVLNKDYPNLFFQMVTSSYATYRKYKKEFVRLPIEVLCHLKSIQEKKLIEENDPFFDRLFKIFPNPYKSFSLDKEEISKLQNLLGDRNYTYRAIQDNGEKIKEQIKDLKNLINTHFVSLEDSLIDTYMDYLEIRKQIEKRKAIRISQWSKKQKSF